MYQLRVVIAIRALIHNLSYHGRQQRNAHESTMNTYSMKKLLIFLLLIVSQLITAQKDSTHWVYFERDSNVYVNDSIISKTYYSGDISQYYNRFDSLIGTIKFEPQGRIWYRADTAYYLTVIEDNAEFSYWLENGKWWLHSMRVDYEQGIYPFVENRCRALTQKMTRCKRTTKEHYCWQHKN